VPATQVLDDLPLVDDHCHGVAREVADREAFESHINEGFDAPPAGTSHFDTPIGLAVRRWCPPALDLEPHATVEEYLDRRAELGAPEANRRLMAASRIGTLLIDTGHRSNEVLGHIEMADLAGVPAREVVRIESVAEEVAAGEPTAAGYAEDFTARLAERARDAVGFKTVVAYRGGFGIDPTRPSAGEVTEAAGRWLAGIAAGGPGTRIRVEEPALLRLGMWAAVDVARERGMPIQAHAGFGDPDLDIHQANPALLTGFLRLLDPLDVNVVFLHCWPYHREAGYLAAIYRNAYFDLGATLHYAGPQAIGVMADALEVTPFTKQLFSSDAFGLAELYVAGAAQFRESLGKVLDGWIADGRCRADDAERVARMVGRENALRIYPVA
jgi:predicted TIM-barrel fold metal-dependent hydrolase